MQKQSRASRLDAVQGSNEERASRIQTYGERAPQVADIAMRQEPTSVPGYARQQGGRRGGRDQNGSMASYVTIMLLVLALLGAAVFAGWAYVGRQDYKDNSDKKVKAAVEEAKKNQQTELEKQFAEAEKIPNRTYKGSTTYGTVTFDYPRTWSAYVDEASSSAPINGYFHPSVVPGVQSKTAYALRVELVNTDYAVVVKQHDAQVKDASAKASAYIPPKMQSTANVQPGTRLDGKLDQDTTGSMVIIKVRDKTLQIYTENNDYLGDFNNTILASLTFAP